MRPKTVMIHGMWGGGWYWDKYVRFFSGKGFDCETPYLRHHDVRPDDPPPDGLGNLSLLDYAADLEATLSTYEEKPILIGHSMGGLIALMLAGRDLAKAAVLITPAPPYGINALKPSVVLSFFGPLVKLNWLGYSHKISEDAANYAVLNRLPLYERKYILSRGVSESGTVVREIGLWPIDWRMASRVKPESVKCPLFIIGAEEDRITPAKVIRKVAHKYGHVAKYKEYAEHAHYIIREPGWEVVAEDVYRWIRSLD